MTETGSTIATAEASLENSTTETAVSTGSQPLTFEQRREKGLLTAIAAAQAVADNRGQNIVVLDLCDLTAIFDYFVIATGTSQRQLRSMCDGVKDVLERNLSHKRYGVEGYEDSRWILCDYGDIVVHLLDEESRKYYALEDLWAGARNVDLTGRVHIK